MATVTSTLKLEDKMSKVFASAEKAAQSATRAFNNVHVSVENIDNKMKKANSSSSSFFNSLLKFNVFQKIFGMITSQLDSAIDRYDTLNNYTKVMSNLGISEEAANASRERLSQGLKGLPTTLDSAVLAVQRFTSANSNVEASTEMYLAMNNALLAGGASMDTQKTAMEQLAQAYSKGKPDMMEWRALQTAMPGQLKQIAKAMGKTTNQLGEDLRSGKTSMNDFMKTAVKLNQEGIDGFANFQDQAKNATGGIKTAIANMQSAIARGWASMIQGANTALEASGLPTINQIIVNLGNTIEQLMTKIGSEAIPQLAIGLQELGNQLTGFVNDVTNAGNTAEESALQGLNAWDFFMIGLTALLAGANVAMGGFRIGLLVLKAGIQAFAIGALAIFNGLLTGVQGIMVALASVIQDRINNIIDILNSLVDAFNFVFGAFGANVERISHMTFADEMASNLSADIDRRNENLLGVVEAADKTATEIQELSAQQKASWAASGQRVVDQVYERKYSKPATDKATKSNEPYDYNKIDELMNGVTGSDGTGGKAVKTTTNDDLLKDEDIQLLLDVATRDYKLNYQQVTPNITLTFGDVRETVDVEDVLDVVADKLEEIYDGNLEVNPA